MRKRRMSLVLSVFMVLLLSLAGCSSAADKGSGTLTVGVRSDIINFGYLNETTGNYYGFEIDLARKMAEKLGYEDVEFVPVQPENRKQMLLDGEVDCLIAAYSISDTRLENFDFSEPYYVDKMGVMVQKSSLIQEFGQLKGKTVGILNGANSGPLLAIKMQEEGMITEILEHTDEKTVYDNDVTVLNTESYAALSQALETGAVDAICLDGIIGQTYMDDDREWLETVVTEQQYGVATQKGSELSKSVAKAISELSEDGTIEQLRDKWD